VILSSFLTPGREEASTGTLFSKGYKFVQHRFNFGLYVGSLAQLADQLAEHHDPTPFGLPTENPTTVNTATRTPAIFAARAYIGETTHSFAVHGLAGAHARGDGRWLFRNDLHQLGPVARAFIYF